MDKEELTRKTIQGGADIIRMKGATFYGIAMAVSNIVETIMKDDDAILPVAHVLGECFGDWAGVPISLPCRIGWEGIMQTLRIPMNDAEKEAMDASVQILKDFLAQVRES